MTAESQVKNLFNRNFILLWQGQVVSNIGTQMFNLALLYWLLETTGSATAMGLIMMAAMLPVAVLTPFGGTIADILPRKYLLIGSDLVQGFACILFVILITTSEAFHLIVLFLIVLVMGIAASVFRPAMRAAMPDIIPESRLQNANALLQASNSAVGAVASAFGGFLYVALGAPVLFLINGVSFLLSAFSECFMEIPLVKPRHLQGSILQKLWRDTKEGFDYVYQTKGLFYLVIAISVLNMTAVSITLSLPIFIRDWLGSDITLLGIIGACQGAAAFVGLGLLSVVKFRDSQRPLVISAAQLLLGALLAATAFCLDRIATVVLLSLYGLCLPFFNVITQTVIMRNTPREIRGRVIGVLTTISASLMPIAMACIGLLIDLIDQNVVVLWYATAFVYLALGLLVGFNPSIRRYLSSG